MDESVRASSRDLPSTASTVAATLDTLMVTVCNGTKKRRIDVTSAKIKIASQEIKKRGKKLGNWSP